MGRVYEAREIFTWSDYDGEWGWVEARARQESVFLSHCVHRFSFSYLRINGRIGSEVNCVLLQ